MSDDIKNKPEGPVQEPLNVGGETKCKNCEQPKSAHLVSGHIYCPISLGRACWYEPVDAATAAPSYPSELPASKLSWPQLPEPSARAVEAARRIIRFFRANPRVMRETVVGRIIDDVFESAPSQAAREFEQHTKAVGEFLNELYATMVDPCEQPQMTVAEMCGLLIRTAREHREIANNYAQQTAAKDEEIDRLRQQAIRWIESSAGWEKKLETAERERDSLLLLLEQSQKENALLYEELTQLKARVKELMNHLSSSGT